MEREQYLHALRSETDTLLVVARSGLEQPVPSCPGWRVGDVLAHVGQALNWMSQIIESRSQEVLWPHTNQHGYDWQSPGLFDWFQASRDRFVRLFGETDPDEPVWSWAGDNRAHFWLRLETMECAIHRWDAQSAVGTQEPIDRELAEDVIDATLRWFVPGRRSRSSLPDRGESYRFEQTDGPHSWSIRMVEGRVVTGGHEATDVVARGTASHILLYLWVRESRAGFEVTGDSAVLDRFPRLLPSV